MKKNHTLVELEEIAQSDEKFKQYFEETIHVPAEEYFNGDKFAIDVFNAKYAIDWGDYKETPGQVFWRLATELDKIEDLLETPKNIREFFKRMVYLLLYEGWFRPGGSIISGLRPDAGKRKISLFNCTTVPLEEDSLEGIFKCVYSVAKCAAYRQGIGVDVSKLRPSGTPIANAAEVSDGPVHWMDFIQQLGNYVGQKGRHLALLLSLKVNHPDIEQFLVAKSDLNKINNANISVQIDDEFMEAVINEDDYCLSFEVPEHGIKVERKIRARDLFRKLAEQAVNYAEPGIQYTGSLFSGKMCYYLGKYLGKEELIPISTNACLSGDTWIVDGDRLVRIGDLAKFKITAKQVKNRDGRLVPVYEGMTLVVWESSKNKKIVRLVTDAGYEIDLTPDHLVLLRDGRWVKAEDTVNQSIALCSVIDRIRNYDIDEEFVFYGFLFGDGFGSDDRGVAVRLNPSREPDVYELLCKYGCYVQSKYTDGSVTLYLPKNSVPKWFRKFIQKTHTKRIPREVFEWPLPKIASFLRGLFEANGSLNKNGQVNYKTVSLGLAQDIQLLLSLFGIPCWISKRATKRIRWPNGEYVSRPAYDLQIAPRVMPKFVRMIGFHSAYKLRHYRDYTGEYRKHVRVVRVDYVGNGPVYDFRMKNPALPYTIANGFVVHNCSEQPLAPYSVCNLLSINMAKFNPVNFKYELDIIAPIIVRFLDDCIIYEIVNDLSPLPQQREIVSKLKEIGCGITNLHLWLLKQGIDYDSDEAIEKVDDFMAHYTASVVMASGELGVERGKAPVLNELSFEEFKEAIKDWHLYKNLSKKFPSVKWDRVFYHCANTSFMSIAPTGSISTSFPEPCFSSGVEPVIGWYYWRKTRAVEKGKYIYYFVIPEPVKRFVLQKIDPSSEDYKTLSEFPGSVRDDDGKIGAKYVEIIKKYVGPDTCKPAHLIDSFKKVELMSRIYKWLDASISCTFNLPETADADLVYDLFLDAYKKGVRAVTVYREGSRDAVLIFDPPPVYERKFLLKQSLCMKRPDDITYHCAPKRPKDLPCDIHQIMVKGKRWVVLVGLLNGKPYEIFAGEYDPDVMYIPKSQTEGIIRKEGRGKYSLVVKVRGSEIEYKDIAQLFMNEEQRSLTRLISLALRHGVPIEFIVDQLKKSIKDITEFSSGVARVLSKYVVLPIDGNKKCPNCGKEDSLVLKDGCYTCLDCGYSKCA